MSELSLEQRSYKIQFQHPEKNWPGLPDEAIAPLFDVDLPTFRRVKETFAVSARAAAVDLLPDPAIAMGVDRIYLSALAQRWLVWVTVLPIIPSRGWRFCGIYSICAGLKITFRL